MKLDELSSFDVNMFKFLAHLYKSNTLDEDLLDTMKEMGFEYHSLKNKNDILEDKINIDPKTNLLKYSDSYLATILKSVSRMVDKVPDGAYDISYIRFDIDDFSFFNNRYGHDKGDRVLVDLARLLKENSRPTDYIIRFGGEEFDVILPATDTDGASIYLQKIYNSIDELDYNFDNNRVKISTSAGVSFLSWPFNKLKKINPEEIKNHYLTLQKFADDALYDAKVSGKNQFKVYNMEIDYQKIREKYSENRYHCAS